MPPPIDPIKQDERLVPAFLRGEIARGSDEAHRAGRALITLFSHLIAKEGLIDENSPRFEIFNALIGLFDPGERNVVIRKNWAKRPSKFRREYDIAIPLRSRRPRKVLAISTSRLN
jgi:hypothetical protein